MKRIVLLTSICWLSIFNFSPSYCQNWMWGKAMGAYAPTALAIDNDENIVTTFCSTYGICPMAYTLKYDSLGNLKWATQSYPHDANSLACGVAITTDKWNNVITTGYCSDLVTFGNDTLSSNMFGSRTYIVKYDKNGNLLWARQCIGAATPSSIVNDKDGGFYLAGYYSSAVSFGSVSLPYLGAQNIFVVKFDSAGNALWGYSNAKVLNNTIPEAIDSAGNLYIMGQFHDTVTFGTYTLISNLWAVDLFLVKFASDGKIIWARQSHTPQNNGPTPRSLSCSKGYVYITGQFTNETYFGKYHLTDTLLNADEIFIVKYDSLGNVKWAEQSYNHDGNVWEGNKIIAASDQYFYLAGGGGLNHAACKFTIGDTTITGTGSSIDNPFFISEFDSAGKMLCYAFVPGGYDLAGGEGLATNSYGKYVYVSGVISAYAVFGSDTLGTGQTFFPETYFARWNPCFVNERSAVHNPSDTAGNPSGGGITIFPNPFSSSATIELSRQGDYTLELYDILGRKLQSFQFTGKEYKLSSQGMAQGMYFIRVFDISNSLIGTSKVIVQ
jgi:hypothetical protein